MTSEHGTPLLPCFLQYGTEAVEKPEVEETSRTVQCRMYGIKRARGVYRAELDSDFKERRVERDPLWHGKRPHINK